MSGHASYDDAHDVKYGEPHLVPLVRASAESLKGYGWITYSFDDEVEISPWPVSGWRPLCPGTGNQGGITSGDFVYKWHNDLCTACNTAVPNGDYVTGRLAECEDPNNRRHVLVREANYHPDGGQMFFPSNGDAFVALLALPGDDIKLEDFRAFYFDGSFGVHIHANIWHQPIYPVCDEAVLKGKQGKVHACVALDTVEEFGKFLKVPLQPDLIATL